MMRAPPHVRPPRPELRVFLEDIRESPGDDRIRLILADWLEDQGDEGDQARAELIRLQCSLPRGGREARRLRRREAELLADWADDWLGPLARLAVGWSFDRGLARIALRAHTCFDAQVEEVSHTEAYSWVESLSILEASPGVIGQLVRHPLLGGVSELSFVESRVGDQGLELLAQAQGLSHLRALRLAYSQVSGRGLAALRARTSLPALQALDLAQNRLSDDDLASLLLSPDPPRWQSLGLGFNGLGDGAVALLAQSPLFPHLHTLDLQGNTRITSAGVESLVAAQGSLRSLNLSQARIGRDGAEALGSSPSLGALEELHLGRCDLRDEGAKALLLGSGLPKLRTLCLGRGLLGDEAAIAVALGRPRPWRRLDLSGGFLGPEGAEALAGAACLENLEELSLARNEVGDDGAYHLAASTRLGRLRHLDLADSGLTAAGRRAILRRFGRDAVLA
jgi:uncharacterized protein (TIGR02996 family)